jgi:TetR/AcrR family transcriptional regulator, repressor for uid operon
MGWGMTRVTPEHTDARMRAIQDAAFVVFASKGSEKATMAEIAREAGLSAGTLYLYYPSKADLLRDVCMHKADNNQRLFEQAATDGHTPLEILGNVGRTYADMFSQEGFEQDIIVNFEALIAGAREPEGLGVAMKEGAETITAMLQSLIDQAQAAGEIDPDVDARTLATVLHAVGLGLRELRLTTQGEVDIRAGFAVMIEMVRRLTPVGTLAEPSAAD